MNKNIIAVLEHIHKKNEPYALATVIETIGSVSAKTGSKAIINNKGTIITGWVGGGCAESAVCDKALQCIKDNTSTIIDVDLNDEILGAGMPCGGSMRIYVESVLPNPTIWLMGHGAIAEYLCQLADLMNFDVIVNDANANKEKYPAAKELIIDDISYKRLNPKAEDFVVIATQHKGDHESIKQALSSKAKYIALIASGKRSNLVLEYLKDLGLQNKDLQRVVAPCGLDLGSRTPQEIALCIISEIVLLRRGGSGIRMCDKLSQKNTKNKSIAL